MVEKSNFYKGELVGDYEVQFVLGDKSFRALSPEGKLVYMKELNTKPDYFVDNSVILSKQSTAMVGDRCFAIEEFIPSQPLDKYLVSRQASVKLVETLLRELLNLADELQSSSNLYLLKQVRVKDIVVDLSDRPTSSFKIINLDRLVASSEYANFESVLTHLGKTCYYLFFGNNDYTDFWFDDTDAGIRLSKVLKQILVTGDLTELASFSQVIDMLDGNVSTVQCTPNKPNKSTNKVGFAAIAGMDALKETLQVDVIDALKDRALYERYGLSIPNGVLFYGPPGCGKTFFANKLAEELGINFFSVSPSDLQSKFVNETQEKISELFTKAEVNSPSIVFIDEIDAIAPSRDRSPSISHMNLAPINELLTQINRCGHRGVFVVGATNLPSSIDNALLRTGRFDKKILVPAPDEKARETLFKDILRDRPLEEDVCFTRLARLSNNYVASDICFICDEASRQALRLREPISQQIMETELLKFTPSLTAEQISAFSEDLNG